MEKILTTMSLKLSLESNWNFYCCIAFLVMPLFSTVSFRTEGQIYEQKFLMPLEASYSASVVYELQVIPFLSNLCITKVSGKLSVLWHILTNNVIHCTKDGYHSMLVELIHVNLGWTPVAYQVTLSLPSSTGQGGGENKMEKTSWVKKKAVQ